MRSATAVAVAAAVSTVVAAAAAGIAIVGRPTPSSVEPSVHASYVVVDAATTDRSQKVTVDVGFSDSFEAVSSGASGVVTRIWVHEGDSVRSGTPLYDADGTTVYAIESEIPLFRPLVEGDNGKDVEALQSFLGTEGVYKGAVDGKFGPKTDSAYRAWEKKIGDEPNGTVDFTRFIRIPSALGVASIDVSLGHLAPGVGEAVLVSSRSIVSIEIAGQEDLKPGVFTFRTNGDSVELRYDGTGWSSPDEATLAATVSQAVLPAADSGDQSAMPASSGSSPGSHESAQGNLALSKALSVAVVPAAALAPSTRDSMRACVWTEASTEGSPTRQEVSVVGTAPSGAVFLSETELEGTRVLIDPLGSLPDGAACP